MNQETKPRPGKLAPKPQRAAADPAALDAFVKGAPDANDPAPVAPAAAKPVTADSELPRTARKRKEPITITVDPGVLHDFDQIAGRMGLSRASALGMAMYNFIQEAKAKAA